MANLLTRTRSRVALCALCVCCALALGASAASGAALQPGKSFNELTSGQNEAPTTPTRPTTPASTSSASTGTSHTLIFIALGAAAVLLSGIAFVIVRDARRVAPASEADVMAVRSGNDASVRMRKRRARAKAARRQRKRNR